MDKPYSYEYFNFMGSIRDIESSIENITNLEDRLNLENDVGIFNYSFRI